MYVKLCKPASAERVAPNSLLTQNCHQSDSRSQSFMRVRPPSLVTYRSQLSWLYYVSTSAEHIVRRQHQNRYCLFPCEICFSFHPRLPFTVATRPAWARPSPGSAFSSGPHNCREDEHASAAGEAQINIIFLLSHHPRKNLHMVSQMSREHLVLATPPRQRPRGTRSAQHRLLHNSTRHTAPGLG
ncbi:hypothetical protein FA95DRAFT_1030950 [Auriscalpium vulgare]|uniref:Uncharacterized protein n=1 Tax=Auriscalpium vulgare TaxID=40419 RepID=A0ACB8RWW2_9AGAM|nr:hypothetical protein FA95DRAFT_1030950 [Auriscalpium vulgare]